MATKVKTAGQQVVDVSKYVLPSGAVGGAVAIVLEYFLSLPTEVTIALGVIIMAAVNLIGVYVVKRLEK